MSKRMGVVLIWIGLITLVVGCVIYFYDDIPFLGKLPGDFVIKRKNFVIYLPITSSLVVSLILSLILYLVRRFG